MMSKPGLLSLALMLVMVLACGHFVEVPDWEIELWLVPGVYTHVRGDSLSIGYQCVVKDRIGEPPGSVALLEVRCSDDRVVAIGEDDFCQVWKGASLYPGYSLTERVETAQSGIYVWHLVDTDGNEVAVGDSLAASPIAWDVDRSQFHPADSSTVGEEIVFVWPSAGSQYEYVYSVYDTSDSLIRRYEVPRNTLYLADSHFEPNTWYWWSLQLWDLRRDNCWESGGMWFRTGE
jgi:hypothetical protein